MSRHPNQQLGYGRPFDLTIADHAATFTVHPLDGSSRFSLLGLLAGLHGVTRPFDCDPATDEQKRLVKEMNTVMTERFDFPDRQKTLLDEYEEASLLERVNPNVLVDAMMAAYSAPERELAMVDSPEQENPGTQ